MSIALRRGVARPRIVAVERDDEEDSDASSSSSCDEYEPLSGKVSALKNNNAVPTPEQLLQELSTEDDDDANHRSRIPKTHWRDGLCDLFRLGYCHPSVLTACFCVPCAAGQVATRLHLSPFGRPNTTTTVTTAAVFRTIVQWCAAFWGTRLALFLVIALWLDPNTDADSKEWVEPSPLYYAVCALDDLLAWVYMLACVVQLRHIRRTVRRQYQIPTSVCCWEDSTCSLVCPCLVAAQLLRHTADYEQQPAARVCCCSATGVVPTIV